MTPKKILITRPKMVGDNATGHTFSWAIPVIKYAKDRGYEVLDYQRHFVTYNNISNILESYKPDFYIHFGHGCPSNLIGQSECIITNGHSNFNIEPMHINSYLSNYTYRMDDDIMCDKLCPRSSNVELLNGIHTAAYSCHSAHRLAKCAMGKGAKSYAGFDDYLIFMTDSIETENIFRDSMLQYTYSLLDGDTVRTATNKTLDAFDRNIKKYKHVDYLGKLLLWDRMYFRTYGNPNLTLFS